MQTDHEQLIPAIGTVPARQIEQLRERFTLPSDTLGLLAARDLPKRLIGVPQLGGWPIGARPVKPAKAACRGILSQWRITK
jgi:hypothetical protein